MLYDMNAIAQLMASVTCPDVVQRRSTTKHKATLSRHGRCAYLCPPFSAYIASELQETS